MTEIDYSCSLYRVLDADHKAPQIESLEIYRKWRRQGWPNALLKDEAL